MVFRRSNSELAEADVTYRPFSRLSRAFPPNPPSPWPMNEAGVVPENDLLEESECSPRGRAHPLKAIPSKSSFALLGSKGCNV